MLFTLFHAVHASLAMGTLDEKITLQSMAVVADGEFACPRQRRKSAARAFGTSAVGVCQGFG